MDARNSDKLRGVDCGVVNCKYHCQDDSCTARSISVENRRAMNKAETFCGTFSTRSEG